jgi:hypothetical protein
VVGLVSLVVRELIRMEVLYEDADVQDRDGVAVGDAGLAGRRR